MCSFTPVAQAASQLPTPAQSLFVNTLTSVPVYGPVNPAAKSLDAFEQFDEGSAFGLMLAVATVSLWGYWAGGLLLSGSGGTEVVESVVKIALSGVAIVMWPELFKDAISIVNALCSSIVNAPFAHRPMQQLAVKLGIDTALTAKAGIALASQMGSKLGLVGGISIASFVATGDPFAWILDFIVTLLFMVGQLIIEIERLAMFATTTFIYVAGPLVIALWAFRGLTPTVSAFFRIAQSVLLIVLVWTIFLVLFAIMDSAVAPVVWNVDPRAWFASIGDHLTSLVLLWMLVFTPGIVRRHVGGGGAGATGVLRTAALLGGYRVLRGGGRGTARAPKAKYTGRHANRPGATSQPSASGRGASARPSAPGSGATTRPSPPGKGARKRPSSPARDDIRHRSGGNGAPAQPSPPGSGATARPSGPGTGARQRPSSPARDDIRHRSGSNGATARPSAPSNGAIAQPAPPSNGTTPRPSPPSNGTTAHPDAPSNGASARPSPPSDGTTARPSPPSDGTTARPSPPGNGATQRPSAPSNGATARPTPPVPRPGQAGRQPNASPPPNPAPQNPAPQPGP